MTSSTDALPSQTAWSPPLLLSTLIALVGGAIGLTIFQMIDPVFPFEAVPELPIEPTDEQVAAYTAAQTDFYSRNYAIGLTILGATLGLFVGAGTVPRKRAVSGLAAGLLGALGGAATGYFTGFPVGHAMVMSSDQSLVQSSILHFSVWFVVAIGICAGAGWVQGGFAQAVQGVLAGFVASLLVVVAYTLVASIAFPEANLIYVVPQSLAERITWMVICCGVFGLALSFGLKPAKPDTSGGEQPTQEQPVVDEPS